MIIESDYNFADLLKEALVNSCALKDADAQINIDEELPLQLHGDPTQMKDAINQLFSSCFDVAKFDVVAKDGATDDDIDICFNVTTVSGREVSRVVSQKAVCMQVFGTQAVSLILSSINPTKKRVNVLLIDSQPANSFTTFEALKLHHAVVTYAPNLLDAMKQFEAKPELEVILIDLSDGTKFGIQTAKVLNKANCTKPILGLGSAPDDAELAQLFDGFLSLPLKYNCITKAFKMLLTTSDADVYQDPEVQRLVVKDFLKANNTARAEIEQALASNDLVAAHRVAHNLKSLATLLGNVKLKTLALVAETNFRQEKLVSQSVLDEMLDCADQIAKELQ